MKNLGITFPCTLILLVILTGFAVPQAQAAGDRCWTSKPSYLVGERVVIYVTMTQIASYYLDVTNQASHVTTTYPLGYVSSPPKTTTVTGTASLPAGVRTIILRNSLGQRMYCPMFEVTSSPPGPPPSRPTYQLTIKVDDWVTHKPIMNAEVHTCCSPPSVAWTNSAGTVRMYVRGTGNHQVSVKATNYIPFSQSVYVERDTAFTVHLTPLPTYTVTVWVIDYKTRAPLPFANIYIDGVYKCQTRPMLAMCAIGGVTLGSHQFLVKKNGYYSSMSMQYIDGPTSLTITLRPIA